MNNPSYVRMLLIVQLVTGMSLAFVVPTLQGAHIAGLASDFDNLRDRLQEDPAGKLILYGSKNLHEDFDRLLRRLLRLRTPMIPVVLGCFISLTAGAALILQERSQTSQQVSKR